MSDYYHRRLGHKPVRLPRVSEIYQMRADVIHGRVMSQEEILELLEVLDAYADIYWKAR